MLTPAPVPIPSDPRGVALARVLRSAKGSMLATWEARVRADGRVPLANALSSEELLDHAPVLLDETCDALEGHDAPEARRNAAVQHGAQRVEHGYDIRAVVREMAILRDVVVELLESTELPLTGAPGLTLHGVFDDAIAASVESMESVVRGVLERERDEAARARRRAESADADKELYLAVIAHEIRTPLHAVLGWVALARHRAHDDELLARAIETIDRNVALQSRLVDDLLDLARVRSGKLTLDLQHVELTRVVSGAVESARPIAAAKSVELVLERLVPAFVQADPERLLQVISNLLANALKFTPRGGHVEVRVERPGEERVRVVVHDDGAGIAPEILGSMFEAFRQGDPLAGTRAGGLGLGLAIVREVVDAHGGRVGAESDGVGKGATFWIELPIAR